MYLLSSRNAAFERLDSGSNLKRLSSSRGVSGEGGMAVSCETGCPVPVLALHGFGYRRSVAA